MNVLKGLKRIAVWLLAFVAGAYLGYGFPFLWMMIVFAALMSLPAVALLLLFGVAAVGGTIVAAVALVRSARKDLLLAVLLGAASYLIAVQVHSPVPHDLPHDPIGYTIGLLRAAGVLPTDSGQQEYTWTNAAGTPGVQVRGNYMLHVQECWLTPAGETPPGYWPYIDYLADREPRFYNCQPMSPDHLTVIVDAQRTQGDYELVEGAQGSFLLQLPRVERTIVTLIVTGRWSGEFSVAGPPERYHRAGERWENKNRGEGLTLQIDEAGHESTIYIVRSEGWHPDKPLTSGQASQQSMYRPGAIWVVPDSHRSQVARWISCPAGR